jgi:Ca-activated chloride channel family protein
MTFHWPHFFWLLLVPLVLLVRDLRRHRVTGANLHPKIQQAEATRSSLVIRQAASARGGALPRRRIFLYLGLATATLALARPQWGRLEEPVFDQAREIIIALDLSRSMLAEDVKPSRLERARLLITSLLERLKGERVGLIVFSGTAFLQSPLSADYEILREFLPVLDPGYLPEGGTNYDALLETTLSAFGDSGAADRFLIVLSDGEALDDSWHKHVAKLKTKGIRVLGLGIGTAGGAMIPDGSGAFMKDERGAVVLSKLNSVTLRELSEKTDGVYSDASSWVDLSLLLKNTVEQGRQGEFTETNRVRLAERFQWPLAAALVLFLLSFWREFPVRPKPRAVQLAAKVASLASVFFLLCAPFSANAAEAPSTALAAPVTQLVGRLSSLDNATANDYAELARATVTYGERAQASKETVPEGPVRDALVALDAGQSLDPKAADWPGLREQLEALLPKKDPQPPKQDKSKPDEKKPEQNKDDKSQKQDDPGEKGDSAQADKTDQQDKQDKPQNEQQDSKSDRSNGGEKSPGSEPKKNPDTPGQSAFGDMKDQPPPDTSKQSGESTQPDAEKPETDKPASAPSEMQQVGGASSETSTDPARLDPSLTIPLQKLDQVKQGDSPAHLFRLLQEPASGQPAPKGKDW